MEDHDLKEASEVYEPPKAISAGARVKNMAEYKKMYDESINDNDGFWTKMAKEAVEWFSPFNTVSSGGFEQGDVAWFLNGKLNVSYNCVDRHAKTKPNKVAILWEGDDSKEVRRVTYGQLLQQVCQAANALKRLGVRKGDSVCIYMPMVPEAAVAMLACTRIGAPHSVVFAGFSAESLKDRLQDGNCHYVITADEGLRAGKPIPLKRTVDDAIAQLPEGFVKHVLMYKRTGSDVPLTRPRDVLWSDAVTKARGYCPCEWVDSEDTMFMLYTSGSTGKPKGIQHSTGGYLVYAATTHKYIFDVKEDDVYACVADVGWVTGHSYIVYGPLCNGTTTFMFESTPLFPDAGRYWDMVERHKISIFYTAPTAIRALMKFGTECVSKYNRSSLRVLGSVGEPINPEAWKWYYEVVGESRCAIVDTYWQTETGGIIVTPLPGCTPMVPGACVAPFFGIELALLDTAGNTIKGNGVKGILVLTRPWPGMARTIFGDHERYLQTYMTAYKGYYFTGDGSTRDKQGFYWVTGRVDDVINVSGHRLGSAEIESALVCHPKAAEAAVIGIPHNIKGQALFAYVTCKVGVESSPALVAELRNEVRKHVGGFAVPDEIVITPALPKTRSGKIMRRILRKIACDETDQLGDITTLADSDVIKALIAEVARLRKGGAPAAAAASASAGSAAGPAPAEKAAKEQKNNTAPAVPAAASSSTSIGKAATSEGAAADSKSEPQTRPAAKSTSGKKKAGKKK